MSKRPDRPDQAPETFILTDEDRVALFHHPPGRTREIVDVETQKHASAVKVCIGGRYFLATAGHFLRDARGHELEVVRRVDESPFPANYVNVCWHEDDSIDVGLVELCPGDAAAIEPFVDDRGILANWDQNREQNVLVVGFSQDTHVKVAPSVVVGAMVTFVNTTVMRSDWPAGHFEHEPTDGVDLFVGYDDETNQQMMGSGMEPIRAATGPQQTPNPMGMSGGGIWLPNYHRHPSSGLLQPNAQLLGLQVSFLPDRKLLRGVQIDCWLSLAEREYPDLAADVARLRARRLPGDTDSS